MALMNFLASNPPSAESQLLYASHPSKTMHGKPARVGVGAGSGSTARPKSRIVREESEKNQDMMWRATFRRELQAWLFE